MGVDYFDQDKYLTLYVIPKKVEATRGEQVTVTYTITKWWTLPKQFGLITLVIHLDGTEKTVIGHANYTVPAEYTV